MRGWISFCLITLHHVEGPVVFYSAHTVKHIGLCSLLFSSLLLFFYLFTQPLSPSLYASTVRIKTVTRQPFCLLPSPPSDLQLKVKKLSLKKTQKKWIQHNKSAWMCVRARWVRARAFTSALIPADVMVKPAKGYMWRLLGLCWASGENYRSWGLCCPHLVSKEIQQRRLKKIQIITQRNTLAHLLPASRQKSIVLWGFLKKKNVL